MKKHKRIRAAIDGVVKNLLEFFRPEPQLAFNVERLEERQMLTLTPTISGASTGLEGSSYTLNLSPNNNANVASWTIDWGDGQIENFTGSPATRPHTYADGTKDYLIDAMVTESG